MRTIPLLLFLPLSLSCSQGRQFEARLSEAENLRAGSAVTYRGLEIGRVEGVVLSGSDIVTTFRVTRSDAPIRSTDRARVRASRPLGDAQLEIIPGDPSGFLLAAGGSIPAAAVDPLDAERKTAARAIVEQALKSALGPNVTHDSVRTR